jgi:ABC-type antimicrobial peptide transport system permease subunit
VGNVAESSQTPANFNNNNGIDWPGKDPASQIWFRDVVVSPEYGKTVGWTITQGRDFSRDFVSDSSAAILNQTAADTMNLKDPIGTRITYFGNDYTVIGIAKDMLTQSPYRPEEPAVFFMKGYYGCIIIRIKPGAPVHEALATIEPVFKKYNPDSPFEFQFVDESYGHKFANEERIGKLAGFFASLAIFISCLGIFGLAAYTAERRNKEIGIRKVLGASIAHLWGLLSREFIVLVTISSIIAVPVAIYFMSGWLKNYSYHITLSWDVFGAAVAGAAVITMATVSYQVLKAAFTDPVKSLRTE